MRFLFLFLVATALTLFGMDAEELRKGLEEAQKMQQQLLDEQLRNIVPIEEVPEGAYLEDVAAMRSHVAGVLKLAAVGDYSKAFDLLEAHSALPESEFDQLEVLTIRQMGQTLVRFGKPIDYEIIQEKRQANQCSPFMVL